MFCFDPNNCSINIANISYNGILQVISVLFLANLSGTKDHMLMLSRAAHYIISQENIQTFLEGLLNILCYCNNLIELLLKITIIRIINFNDDIFRLIMFLEIFYRSSNNRQNILFSIKPTLKLMLKPIIVF